MARTSTKLTILVVAAVIEKEGKILIGQRRNGARHALKWEFPGGKVEKGETPREALARELKEELEIEAAIGPEVSRYEVRYPKRPPILLIFHRVSEYAGEMQNRVFERVVWEEAARLPTYDFLEGDVDFVNRLAKGLV